jgi:hypothetical protein
MKLAATINALITAIPNAVIKVIAGISSIGPNVLITSKITSQYQTFT